MPNQKSRVKNFLFVFFGTLLFITGLWAADFFWFSPINTSQTSPSNIFPWQTPEPVLSLAEICDKYQSLDKNITIANNQSLAASPLVFTSSQFPEKFTLNTQTFPLISEAASKAKVPILMYHDILSKKEVFFDVTPTELENHFELIKSQQATPISLNQLIIHLRTGIPLPKKPILLSFDDGYGGHYEYVYPLLKKYNYPAVFSIATRYVGDNTGRTHVSWEDLKIMAADPLVTIASHSVNHPADLTKLSEQDLTTEIIESKRVLESKLGIPIHYFTYPAGKHNDKVKELVQNAGYIAALSMDDAKEIFAGESVDLFAIGRFGQSQIQKVLPQANGGANLPLCGLDFQADIRKEEKKIEGISFVFVSGGKPVTIHADSRYQIEDIVKGTGAVAAVDGTFFSLKSLNSNIMIGPVLSKIGHGFIPGYRGEIPKLKGRPLVLINDKTVKFVPFDPDKHNTLTGIQAEMNPVNDIFVAAAWLVRDGQPQPAKSFNNLYGFDAKRYRAFWGINQDGQPEIGISRDNVDSIQLGKILAEEGFVEAVMLDSGDSTSLVYQGKSMSRYRPRPVPHAVALFPNQVKTTRGM
ncbi:polysaccharide deacetylase family protein [Calothrix sp. NIES-3974]|uniref:polysaccharide deacetylase family protein n=1 Tax=Calothrix sp. NIES-3974 TaxID=2005462 RepID=UPI000B6057A0|nr:polysaccharide deacetylase family protein [Calothrix sp. NIES-3974]BAZ07344.1 polysaccharide deacetylase family protein [Calothrix sp. NIES-3974]